MKLRKVPFQKARLMLFGFKQAYMAGRYKDSDPVRAAAYIRLAKLSSEAIDAVNSNRQEFFISKLNEFNSRPESDLERMLNGTHEDVPEWLRKNR